MNLQLSKECVLVCDLVSDVFDADETLTLERELFFKKMNSEKTVHVIFCSFSQIHANELHDFSPYLVSSCFDFMRCVRIQDS